MGWDMHLRVIPPEGCPHQVLTGGLRAPPREPSLPGASGLSCAGQRRLSSQRSPRAEHRGCWCLKMGLPQTNTVKPKGIPAAIQSLCHSQSLSSSFDLLLFYCTVVKTLNVRHAGQYSTANYRPSVVRVSRTCSSCLPKTLYPLTSESPPLPGPRRHHATIQFYEFDYFREPFVFP